MSVNKDSATIDLDDFLPMPGAESVVTPDSGSKNANMFNRQPDINTDFLDQDDEDEDDDKAAGDDKDDKGAAGADDNKPTPGIDDILGDDAADDADDQDDAKKKGGRPKTDKSALVKTVGKLIEKGTIIPFDDDKALEDYSEKDFEELLQANFEERERALREQTPKEFFESLPEELQYAAKYVAEGGTDLKGLFTALARTEETRGLDPSADADMITRQYLRATQFGSDEEIEAQIQEWEEFGTLEKKANAFKPKLEKMQEQVLQEQIKRQEEVRKQQKKAAEDYMENVYETLKVGDLNGVKLDKKTQSFLFQELTDAKYDSLSGRKTNLLGHLLEKYQFVEPRYDLVAEAMWLLSNPDEYKEQIRQQAKNAATADTVRKLKTEEGRKLSSATTDDKDDNPTTRKIQRNPQRNFFGR